MPWLYRYSIQHPRTVITIAVVITVAVAPGALRLRLRTDGHALVPMGSPAIQQDQVIRERFGLHDPVVVLIQANHPDGIFNTHTLELTKTLTDDFEKMEGVGLDHVTSLATEASDRVVPGTFRFQNLLSPMPGQPADLDRLRKDLEAIRLYTGTVASRDGKSTSIFVGVPDSANRTDFAQSLRDRIDAHAPFPETIQVIGAPIAESLLGTQILDDLGVPRRFLGRHATSLTSQRRASDSERPLSHRIPRSLPELRALLAQRIGLVPVTLLVMAGVFLVCFRTSWAPLLPLMEVAACLIVTFGLMGWFNVPIYLTIAILPVILTVTSVTDEVHVFGRYTRVLRENPDAPPDEVTRRTMDQMWMPIVQTAVTTAVGFLSFATSPIKPVLAFGIWAGVGTLVQLIWSMSVIPAKLTLIGRWMEGRTHRSNGPSQVRRVAALRGLRFSAFFEWLGTTTRRYRYVALGLAGLLILITPLGLRKLYVQDSWIDGFAPSSAFRQATRRFNEQYLGTHLLQVCVETHRPEYHGELKTAAIDRQFIRLPARVVDDPGALVGYEILLTRQRPVVVTAGPNAGQHISLNWLSWILAAQREGDAIVLTTSMNRGQPGPTLHPESDDVMTYRLRPNPFKTSPVLHQVATLESFIREQRDARVGGVIGPATFLSTTNFMSHARNETRRSIPSDPEQIDFLWKQYQWVRGPERLQQVVDPSFERGLITVYMNDANFVDTGKLLDRLRAYEKRELAPHGISLTFAGDVAVSQTLIAAIVSTQVRSLLGSLVGIFLVTALLARSVGWGLYCMLPCCLGVLLNFAVMGWVGMPLGVATSMFAAITLGIGVDYAIHLLECYQYARRQGRTHAAGLVEAVKTTGPPVFIDALAVAMGFGVMTLSQVPANARLGGLVVLNLFTCLAATLLLLPALLDIYQPRAVRPKSTSPEVIPEPQSASNEQ